LGLFFCGAVHVIGSIRMLYSLTTMKQFSIGVLAVSSFSSVSVICCGDFSLILSRIMPLVLCLQMRLPKSVSKVMIILSCLFAMFNTSVSFRPCEVSRIEVMFMPFCLSVWTVFAGMFSSARNLSR